MFPKEITSHCAYITGDDMNGKTGNKNVSVMCNSEEEQLAFVKQQREKLLKKYPEHKIDVFLTLRFKDD